MDISHARARANHRWRRDPCHERTVCSAFLPRFGGFADDCGKQNKCEFKPVWAEVDRAIGSVLNNITFEELARRARMNQRQLMYHI